MKRLFGTDGVRGVANLELTPEMAFRIGRISAHLLAKRFHGSFFVVGKDTRISGDMLEGALIAGINSSGVDVRLVGVVSTPCLSYLTHRLGAAAGIMISASHNPIEDNGLKIFGPDGMKISESCEGELEDVYFQDEDPLPRPVGGAAGRVYQCFEAVGRYTDFLKEIAPDLGGVRLAIDCGHGAAYKIAPELFQTLGASLMVLNDKPNGININVDCGSTNPAQLQEAVRESGALMGLAFDGDADRLIAVDEKGRITDGDVVMSAFARHLIKRNRLKNNTLVATIMSNGALEVVGERSGFKVVRTPVGDRYVLEKMLEGGYNLGGEQSGHIIQSDYNCAGDGLLTALQLLRVIREEGEYLSSFVDSFPRFPQVLVNCRVSQKNGWEEIPAVREAMKKARGKIGPYGRIVIRPSGTEPLMRVMIEGEGNEEELRQLAEELCGILSKELN